MPLDRQTAVAIIVTDTGHVQSKTITVPESVDLSDLEKMVNILNEKLSGVPMEELHNKIFKEIVTVLRGYVHNYDSAIKCWMVHFKFRYRKRYTLEEKQICFRDQSSMTFKRLDLYLP